MANIETDVEVLKVKQANTEEKMDIRFSVVNEKLDKIIKNELIHLKTDTEGLTIELAKLKALVQDSIIPLMQGIEKNLNDKLQNLEKIISTKETIIKDSNWWKRVAGSSLINLLIMIFGAALVSLLAQEIIRDLTK